VEVWLLIIELENFYSEKRIKATKNPIQPSKAKKVYAGKI